MVDGTIQPSTTVATSGSSVNKTKRKPDEENKKEVLRRDLLLPSYVTQTNLNKKYGKVGEFLASTRKDGSHVRIIRGSTKSGGAVFAVKVFRRRYFSESEKEYQNKITAQFCVASTLKHPNVIETVDIVWNEGFFYEIVEYAPFDLYSIVSTAPGKMSSPEIYCVFRQICAGVEYIHELGIAHRNLKLNKCVLTTANVVKLIDFGTATVFHYPGKRPTPVIGIVGSDNYLAPEVLKRRPYDARKADVWSVGIIFVTLMLQRFPWKLAGLKTDPKFKAFVDTNPDLSLKPSSR
ncbi:kinase-like domain-containing protein, partial [Mycena crocata]